MTARYLRDRSALVVTAAAAFYGIFIARTRFSSAETIGFTLFDDAMISMRYARNFAEGRGLVFNPGEAVEGYSNPLWTIWMTLVHLSGVPDTLAPFVVALSGALLLFATGWIAYHAAQRTWGSSFVATAALFLVLFNYAFVYWTLRGMEVGLLGLLFLGAIWKAIRFEESRDWRHLSVLALALMAAALTRRDAALAAVVLVVYFGWTLRGRDRVMAVSATIAATAVALGIQTIFSLWYYGDPLPNTYYLKMTGTPLAERLTRGLLVGALAIVRTLAPLIVLAAVPLCAGTGRQRRAAGLILGLFCAQLAYSIYAGGDAWEYNGYANRHVATALPGLCILAAAGAWLAAKSGRSATLLACVLVTAAARVVFELGSVTWHWLPSRGYGIYLAAPTIVTMSALALASLLLALAYVSHTRRGVGDRIMLRFASASSVIVAAWLVANAHAFIAWGAANADHVNLDTKWARLGLELRSMATTDAVIAVTAAGNLPYFSGLRTIDLLGKMDPVIARSQPAGEFRPGHDKWNLAHSLAVRPDMIVDFHPTPAEAAYLAAMGYEPRTASMFVLRGTPRLHAGGLK